MRMRVETFLNSLVAVSMMQKMKESKPIRLPLDCQNP